MLGKQKPYDIGLSGTAAEFSKACGKARVKKRVAMQEGALAAFRQGQPENLQALFENPRESGLELDANYSYQAAVIFHKLAEDGGDAAAAISLALAKAPPDEKQKMLDTALNIASYC